MIVELHCGMDCLAEDITPLELALKGAIDLAKLMTIYEVTSPPNGWRQKLVVAMMIKYC